MLAHITVDLLKEGYRFTRKDGAVGGDGQTAKKRMDSYQHLFIEISFFATYPECCKEV
jgi:hypothetical protein